MGEKDTRKKKLKMGILAGITSASVLLGSTFDSPKDIYEEYSGKTEPLREEYSHPLDNVSSFTGNGFRSLVYRIPVRIRTVLCVPMWFAGNGLLLLLEMLYKGVLTPIGSIILGFLLQFVILLGIIAVSIKLLFPDLPWSKILNKRLIIAVFIGSLLMSIVDFIMPMIWDRYRLYRTLSKLIMGLIVIVIILRPFVKRRFRKKQTYEIQYEI